jgi:hypothetical protein
MHGFYQLDSYGEQKESFSGSFPGTVINMQFRTDDAAPYALISEVPLDDDLF